MTNNTADPTQLIGSSIYKCYMQNQGKYYFSEVAVVKGDDVDQQVAEDLKTYFEGYVFPQLGMNVGNETSGALAYSVNITTADDLHYSVTEADDMPYCFAIILNTFDLENYKFDIEYSFNKNSLPDTNLDVYNDLLLAPDLESWGLWSGSGANQLYIYMADFIARLKVDSTGASLTSPIPSFLNTIGYGPI